MIEPDWLQRVLALANADTGDLDPGSLAVLLDEPEELLPYLFVHARGFTGWPQARAALAKAAAGAVRTVPGLPDPPRRRQPASPERDALSAVLRCAIVGGEPEKAAVIADALRLIGTVRLDEDRGDDAPSLFIEHD